ncbi:Integrase zinc binding domain [Popillia japonica]|uniref:Integrase zinc binding domain n=1 Tax=Popillia japonica TaxID=7064 RepID=A0AAW1M089_POPJA
MQFSGWFSRCWGADRNPASQSNVIWSRLWMEWQPCQPYRTVEMATTSSEPLTLLRHVKNVFRISERLENYLELRNLKENTDENDKKRVQILISCLGPKHYQILSNLTAPNLPKEQKYGELIDLLRTHISPKPSEIAEQHKFSVRLQHEGEIRLLQQSTNITFEEAVKLALAIESSKQESKEIKNPLHVNLINKNKNTVHKQDNIKLKTSDTKSNSAKFKCFKCGKNNHKANECKAKNLQCETCGKSGHVKYVCFKTKRGKCDKYIVEVQIEDKKCEMEVDTGGAAVSTICLKQFKAKYPQKLIQPTSILLRTYTGEVIKPVGKSRVKIKYENQTTDGDIYVLNGYKFLNADYKATLNKFLKDDKYPIPRVEDLFAKMSGGKYFCTLDISQAYLHMPVDDESAMLQAISTHKELKKEISSDKVLNSLCTPELPLILATDASPTGLGAVISHVLPDKSERPIAFASRSLTDSEKNYSQIDKESTAIVWGLKKFFHYCYGREIILMTDHKPLTRILRPEKDLPATSAIRLLHYASFMAGFKYEIIYRNTKEHANADYLSRFALQHTKTETLDEEATMKNLARSYVWWRGIDNDIEKLEKKCRHCQINRNDPGIVTPTHRREFPKTPWHRIHVE